jgi:hypothetical protein
VRIALLMALAGAGWLGCNPGADEGVGTTAITDGGAGTDSDARGTDASMPPAPPGEDAANGLDGADGAAASSPACITYCNTIQSACSVDYPQFGSTAACLVACAFYPPGTAADPDNAGNTLKCRQTHAVAAGGHCFHGGPYGYGGCGFMCEGFCQIAMGWCAGSKMGAPFASAAACMTECEGWPWAPNGADGVAAYRPTTPTTGNTLDCREVQLVKSLESAAARDTFCPLAATNSAACK